MNRTLPWARVGVLVAAIAVSGCGSLFHDRTPAPPPIPLEDLEIDDQVTELYAMMRHDWVVLTRRLDEIPVTPPAKTAPTTRPKRPPAEPLRLTPEAVLASMYIPVVGVTPSQLKNSYGAPRDGGRRRHRGIDIRARRGTKVVAVSDGSISYVGTQNKAGRSVWLVTPFGVSFFYAHLDRWANGLTEGRTVRKGDTIGYVGNTGNARGTGPHLHFSIHRDSRAINPYPYLVSARTAERAQPILTGGLTAGVQ